MKNSTLLFTLLLIFTIKIYGQSPTMPVILVSTDKKATHNDLAINSVISGSIMNKKGKLTLESGAKGIIYHDFTFIQIDGNKGPIELANAFSSQDELISQTESDLGEYVSDAVYNAFNSGIEMKNQSLLVSGWGSKGSGSRDGWGSKGSGSRDGWGSKGSGSRDGWGCKGAGCRDGWGSKGKGSRDGWGSKGAGGRDGWGCKGAGCRDGWGSKGKGGRDGWLNTEILSRTLVPGGDYIEGINIISWQPIAGAKMYDIIIEDDKNNIVYQAKSKTNSFSLNSVTAKLELNKNYAWYVHHPVRRIVSTPVPFRIVEKQKETDAISELKTLPIYQNADNTTKLLFEAAILHQKELFNQAKSKYDAALKSAPDNSLAKMMYSYFCNELGEIESAAETLEK